MTAREAGTPTRFVRCNALFDGLLLAISLPAKESSHVLCVYSPAVPGREEPSHLGQRLLLRSDDANAAGDYFGASGTAGKGLKLVGEATGLLRDDAH